MDLEEHRQSLWSLGYRMLGVAAEADDLVQDTFVRAMERPPADTARSVRPWLIKVAANLARDRLRARKARGYRGNWLPTPLVDELEGRAPDPEAFARDRDQIRYGLLFALERLSETQRAVWVLREGLGLNVAETAEALQMSAGNVKTTLHRARAALADVEEGAPLQEALTTVTRLMLALGAGDLDATKAVLADGAASISDGGERWSAAHKVVAGRDRVAKLLVGLGQMGAEWIRSASLGTFGGMPGVYLQFAPHNNFAPLNVLVFDIDLAGNVRQVFSVLDDGSGKLAGSGLDEAA